VSTGRWEKSDESRFSIHDGASGLLAIAGYQNRDKLLKMLGDLGKPGPAGQGGIGGLLDQLRKNLGETTPGRVLIDGLGELVIASSRAVTAIRLSPGSAQARTSL
jgi:hypothetical protein